MEDELESGLDGMVTTLWEELFAQRTLGMKSSIIRDLLKVTQEHDVISFAGGLPAPEVFPIQEFKEAANLVLDEVGAQALQYGPTDGYPPLKEYLVGKMRKYGVPAELGNILLTNGSQQALDLIGKMFIDPGDIVVTEAPTYLGALQAFNAYQPEYLTVPIDESGMQPDKLEDILARNKVTCIYTMPNFQNPSGVTMTLGRRKEIARLAAQYGTFIIEDDPYGELRYEGEDLPPLIALHKENVFYLSTFSKTMAPGIRLGWVVAPELLINKLIQAKQGADLHTSMLIQMLAYDICQRGILRDHVKMIRRVYSERRDVMLAAMEKFFPASGVTWTHPQGGMFLWVSLPEHVDTSEFLQIALEEKVAFVPGVAFYPRGDGKNSMRLNFSNARPEMIEEGIRRLGLALKREFGC